MRKELTSCEIEIELDNLSTNDATKKRLFASPCLQGNTIGAKLNVLLTNHSLSLLIVSGNMKLEDKHYDIGTGNHAVLISTNCIHRKHDVNDVYAKSYGIWMNSAISNLIDKIDKIEPPCVLFPSTNHLDDIFFDINLTGMHHSELLTKRVRIFANQINEFTFEFFLDTYVLDRGKWT